MKKLLFFSVFLIPILGFNQGNDNLFAYQSYASRPTVEISYKGTPYVAADYKLGTTTIHGKTDFKAPMRYNAFENKIEFLDQEHVQRELLRRPYISATIDGVTYTVETYLEDGKEKFVYFNTRYLGETTLLYKPKKILVKEGSTAAYDKIFKYKDVSSYYIKKGNGPAVPVKINPKSILDALDHTQELEAYVTGIKLNLRSEEDVIRVLEFYNSLTKEVESKKCQA